MLELIWTHFIADFVLQSDKIALNKSKSNKWLGLHSLVYSLCFIFWGWKYVTVLLLTHFLIDGITSRIGSFLWKRDARHWFFVIIGFDQALHLSILVLLNKII
jgi:hypothetical protein